ncbi:MAG: hypothetical protein Q4E69_02795 [Bacilli bacterium]|nr:hypothetical protein [Bacilli bacterium]
MKLFKTKINKDSSRVVIHSLSEALIKKNPNVEKEHIITKIKKHERFYTICLSAIFVLVFILITLLVGTSYKYFKKMNSYVSGDLVVEYSPTVNGIGDVITLDDTDIVDDFKIKDNETYKFTITNNSFKKALYKISIRVDKDIIELDGCGNNIFSDNNIKYNINKGDIFSLEGKKLKDRYVLIEDVIPGKSTKVYNLNVWLDKDTLYEGKHFHGIIEVDVC